MRQQIVTALNAVNAATGIASRQYDVEQMFGASVQAIVAGTGVGGSVKIQVSNDNPPGAGDQSDRVTVTNWTDLASATVALTTAGSYLIPRVELAYAWLRVVYVSTVAGVQTVTTNADVSSNLAGKYFLLQAGADGNKYAVWFKVGGAGSAPVVAGYTAAEVDFAANATAATIATAVASAVAALNGTNDFTAGAVGAVITITNKVTGSFLPAADGTSGFAFAVTTPNATITAQLVSKGF